MGESTEEVIEASRCMPTGVGKVHHNTLNKHNTQNSAENLLRSRADGGG